MVVQSVIPALGKLIQEALQFKVIWGIWRDLISK
jgi:hypothetical protein